MDTIDTNVTLKSNLKRHFFYITNHLLTQQDFSRKCSPQQGIGLSAGLNIFHKRGKTFPNATFQKHKLFLTNWV